MKMRDSFAVQQMKHFDDIVLSQKKEAVLVDNPALAVEYAILKELLGDIAGKRVLDVGCGNGRHALRIAKEAGEVIGIDISQKSIDRANQIANEEGINNFHGLVWEYDRPVRERYFDCAFMVNVVHHIDDIDSVLQSVKLALKENGYLVIFEFNPLNVLFIPFLIIHGQTKAHCNAKYFRSNIVTLQKIIGANGLSITRVMKYAWFPTILYNSFPIFQRINAALNAVPVLRQFCAFHVIRCTLPK